MNGIEDSPAVGEAIARLVREHAADRHEQVIELFHHLAPALIQVPTLLLPIADKATNSAHRLNSTEDLLRIHQIAGVCHSQNGDSEAAQQRLRQALAIAGRLHDVNAYAQAQATLGQIAKNDGDLETSRRNLTEALILYRSIGNGPGTARTLGDLGNLEDAAGHANAAIRCYGDALHVFTDLGDWVSVAMVHYNAQVALGEHEPKRAFAHGLLAVAARIRCGDEVRFEETCWQLASWLAERRGNISADLTLLESWFDSEQAAQAQALIPEMHKRMELIILSKFDPEEWEQRSDVIADPMAERMLRHSARILVAGGEVMAGLEFEAVADKISRAYTVGAGTAAREEQSLRERLIGHPHVTGLTDMIDIEGVMHGNIDVAQLDEVRQRSSNPVEQGWLQMLAGGQILSNWQQDDNTAEVLDEAIKRLEHAAATLGPHMAGVWWLQTLRDLGSAYRNRPNGDRGENHERSIAWLNCACRVALRPETVTGRMECQITLAHTLLFRIYGDRAENVESAIHILEGSLSYPLQSPDIQAQLYSSLGLGYASRHVGDPVENEERALRHYEVALGYVTESQSPAVAATINFNTGLLYSQRASGDTLHNEEAALSYLTRSLDLFETAGWRADAADARQARAMVIARMARGLRVQNLDTAITESRTAIATMETLGRYYAAAGALNNLGNLYLDQAELVDSRQANDALQLARQALEQSWGGRTHATLPMEWAQTAHNLANVQMRLFAVGDTGAMQTAAQLYLRALTVRTLETMPAEWAQTTRALASALLDSGQPDHVSEAEQLLGTIVAASERRVGVSEVRASWAALGDIAADAGNWPGAAHRYRRALEIAEGRLAAAVLPGTSIREGEAAMPLFTAVANAQARSGDALGCALTLERSRARLLGEAIERDRRDLGNLAELDAALHDRYVKAATRVRDLARLEAADVRPGSVQNAATPRSRIRYADFEEARYFLESIEAEIRRSPRLSNFIEPFDEGSLARVVQGRGPLLYVLIMSGSLAIIACWSEDRGLKVAAMLGPEGGAGPVLNRLVPAGIALSAPQRRTSFLLAHMQQAEWAEVDIDALCSDLGEALPPELWEWLARKAPDRLTLVPCGPLALAPLHAALAPGTDERFMDRCSIAYSPSARTLASLSPIEGSLTNIAFFGNPTEDPNLSGARREVEELQRRFPAGTMHIGASATCAEILAAIRSAEVLHFAGHGRYDPEQPLESGLCASDGIVTLADISAGRTADGRVARLVTLSACDTAVTDMLSAPDEAIGLPSAFLLAGVDAVIGSLWPVCDDATTELMRYLYDGLANGLSPDTALRAAQGRFRAGRARPAAEWAPFIYVGG